jgi:hypothetical protein
MMTGLTKFTSLLDAHARVILVVSTLGIWTGVGLSFLFHGVEETWRFWQIPTMQPSFVDFRIIPGSAETVRMGLDPTVENPGDPLGRLFNLPRAWFVFFYLDISQDDTVWISILSIVLFFLTIYWLPEGLKFSTIVLMLLVLFSPAAMLLYERGNVDLFLVPLTILTLVAVDSYPVVALFMILMGGIFKLYPIFELVIFMKETRRRFEILLLMGLSVFTLYLVFSFDSFLFAWKHTERGSGISFGVNVLATNMASGLERFLSPFIGAPYLSAVLGLIPYFYALALLFLVMRLCIRLRFNLPVIDSRNLNAFRAGSAIFIGTFLLGNNWDYRLTFLIFVVPQISFWIENQNGWNKRILATTMTSLLLSCWYMFISQYESSDHAAPLTKLLFLADEMINWILFLGLTALFYASAPAWVKAAIEKYLK